MVRLPSIRVNDLRGTMSIVSQVYRSFQQTSVVALSGLLAADSVPAGTVGAAVSAANAGELNVSARAPANGAAGSTAAGVTW
jgi:hypothetical protein